MLELKNINKRFGQVYANKDVCLQVKKGTIHGIIGENGAGKSTLMSILYGFYQADEGEVLIENQPVKISNSKEAIALGIGMVHQHFMLVDTFRAIENILLGAEADFLLAKCYNTALKKIQEIQESYSININLNEFIGDLPVGEKQKVEIFKALYRNAKVLILDEPTSVLTPGEVQEFFQILKKLKKQGVTILLITHKLKEILAITDNVTVMHKGQSVATLSTQKTNADKLAMLMVGREISGVLQTRKSISKKKILEVKDLNYTDSFGISRLQNINFQVFSGEILGIAGVSGNGQTELFEILAGMKPLQQGTVTIEEEIFSKDNSFTPEKARALGLMHIPEDRLETGMLKDFNAIENNILGYQYEQKFLKNKIFQSKILYKDCMDNIENFDVRPVSPSLRLGNFSGGNQQKLLFSREMGKETKIFLVGQPTRGVDIGAIEAIHQKLIEKRNEGKAVLLLSAELEEILALSDRIIVMCQGEIVGMFPIKEATTQKLGLLMGGGK